MRIDLERWVELKKGIETLIPSGVEMTTKDINELGIYASTFKQEKLAPTRVEKFMVKLENGYSVESKRYYYTKQSLLNALKNKIDKGIREYQSRLNDLIREKQEIENDIERMQAFVKEF